MDNQLKPCPFCGATAHIEQRGTRKQSCIVECDSCGVRHDSGDEGERCGTSWNRRAALPSDAAGATTLTRQQIYDKFSFLEGLVGQNTYIQIAETAIEIYGAAANVAAPAPTVAADAAAPINLEGLRKKLLTPRKILRDENGYLSHPDFPFCDEGTNAGKFLDAFGIDAEFVAMESDDPAAAKRYFEAGEAHCSYWTPTPPDGDGWLLLEIFDTEDGPCALFGRDRYEAENALKRQRMRAQLDRIQQRKATHGDDQ